MKAEHRHQTQEFDQEFQEFKKKSAGRSKTSTSTKSAKSPLYRWRGLAEIPAGAITQPQARELLPPKAHIWLGRHGCWAVHLHPHRRYSESWSLSSHHEACMNCVRHVWRLFLADNNMPESACPVRGLFA